MHDLREMIQRRSAKFDHQWRLPTPTQHLQRPTNGATHARRLNLDDARERSDFHSDAPRPRHTETFADDPRSLHEFLHLGVAKRVQLLHDIRAVQYLDRIPRKYIILPEAFGQEYSCNFARALFQMEKPQAVDEFRFDNEMTAPCCAANAHGVKSDFHARYR